MDSLPIPVVKKSCCRCSVKTGSIIIAYAELFSGFFIAVVIHWFYPDIQKDFPILGPVIIEGWEFLLCGFVVAVMSLLGLYGIYQELVWPVGLFLVYNIIGFFFNFIDTYNVTVSSHMPALTILLYWASLVLSTYILLILYSYLRELLVKNGSILRTTQTV